MSGRAPFACSSRQGEVKVFSSSVETGESEESVPSEYAGPDLEIGFNAQYLLDFLRAIPQEQVSFELKDQKSAGELRPAGDGRRRISTATWSCRCGFERPQTRTLNVVEQ